MKIILAVLVTLVLLTTIVTPAHALFEDHDTVKGSRMYPTVHVWTLHKHEKVCSGAPELQYYLDGDTPIEIAMQDFASDLAWHNQMCKMGWIQ